MIIAEHFENTEKQKEKSPQFQHPNIHFFSVLLSVVFFKQDSDTLYIILNPSYT